MIHHVLSIRITKYIKNLTSKNNNNFERCIWGKLYCPKLNNIKMKVKICNIILEKASLVTIS